MPLEFSEIPIEDLYEAVIAQEAFPFRKHGVPSYYESETPRDAAIEAINAMSNSELLFAISLGLKYLEEKETT